MKNLTDNNLERNSSKYYIDRMREYHKYVGDEKGADLLDLGIAYNLIPEYFSIFDIESMVDSLEDFDTFISGNLAGHTVDTSDGKGVIKVIEILGSRRFGVELENNPFSFPIAFYWLRELRRIK